MSAGPLRIGDTRPEDDKVFRGYGYDHRCQQTRAYWLSPAALHRNCVGRAAQSSRKRSASRGIPHDIDTDYLMSIWPTDGLCPALKIPLVWGRGINDDTPALDRHIPSLGYVRGNVTFMSTKANRIKTDATTEEVISVAQYLQRIKNS